jgi:hypothetical protein
MRAVAIYHEGRVIARSRLLAQSGMLLDDPIDRARTLFPEANFFVRDIPFEQAAWSGVLQRINEMTPFVESPACGVAFFRPYDLSETTTLARHLVARVGLGPDKNMARIAAARSSPGAVLRIRDGALEHFLSRTDVSVLSSLGFDEEIPLRLELFGLTTLDNVRALTLRHLRAQFGSDGIALFDLLHPHPEAARVAAYSPPAAVTETFVLDCGTSDFLQLSALIDWMARRVTLRLGRLCCTQAALCLRSENDCAPVLAKHRTFKEPTADPGVISRAGQYLLHQVRGTPFEVTTAALTLSGLKNSQHAQGALFFERPPLNAVVERLDKRFPGALKRAIPAHPGAPFPEDAVRFVAITEQNPSSS